LLGGSGERLWPLSRNSYPKQFLKLNTEFSLLQETALRADLISQKMTQRVDQKSQIALDQSQLTSLESNCPTPNPLKGGSKRQFESPLSGDLGVSRVVSQSKPWIICNEEHKFLATGQLKEVNIETGLLLLEPLRRNTAPAITAACLHAESICPDSLLLVLPADQIIKDPEEFAISIQKGIKAAQEGNIVVFGVQPNSPNTGYGYIQISSQSYSQDQKESAGFYTVERFTEKPDLEIAKQFVSEGNYLWNAGILLFRPAVFLEEMQKHNPKILEYCKNSLQSADKTENTIKLNSEYFERCDSVSIDYALLEKTNKAVCIPLQADWSDVGSWTSLWEISYKDKNGNVLKGDTFVLDSHNCLVQSNSRLVATVGLQDIVVVETDDAVLVTQKGREGEIKEIVEDLKTKKREEGSIHKRVYRPWGTYEVLEEHDNFKVKRIVVNPGASLSLQMHYHRSEHWVVVKGTAEVTLDDSIEILSENQSTYISKGTKHRLKNPGKVPLHIIEVQSGSYLGEDDIVRFEDIYGRSGARI
jgi:mannose-1-phosphate guanylyltransferase/mannose-6-phosphate isomerase